MAPAERNVVLLHGLGRTSRSMRPMERFLARNGYRVVNIGYPSRSKSIKELVPFLEAKLAEAGLPGDQQVDFVTHSAGGIITRAYLHAHPDFPVGRVVMLGPPNQGSVVASSLMKRWVFRRLVGPILIDLGGGEKSLPVQLPPPNYPVGVIAGNRKALYLLPWLIPGESDGLVAVEEAKLPGMHDFLVVPRGHTFLMNSRHVQEQTLAFLNSGAFDQSIRP